MEILRYNASDTEKPQLEAYGPDPSVFKSAVVMLNLGCTARWEFFSRSAEQSSTVEVPHNAVLVVGKGATNMWFRKLAHGTATTSPATGRILGAHQRLEIILRQVVGLEIPPNGWYQVLKPSCVTIRDGLQLQPPGRSDIFPDAEDSDGSDREHSHKR